MGRSGHGGACLASSSLPSNMDSLERRDTRAGSLSSFDMAAWQSHAACEFLSGLTLRSQADVSREQQLSAGARELDDGSSALDPAAERARWLAYLHTDRGLVLLAPLAFLALLAVFRLVARPRDARGTAPVRKRSNNERPIMIRGRSHFEHCYRVCVFANPRRERRSAPIRHLKFTTRSRRSSRAPPYVRGGVHDGR